DPSRGFVNYVDAETAKAKGLVKIVHKQLIVGVDNTSVLDPKSQGRSSVRLESKRTWSSGLLIGDFAHMPGNQCGVWPAFWTYNMRENPISEIDIIEGINHQTDNSFSLHTGPSCTFYPGWQSGKDHRPVCELFDKKKNTTNYGGCGATSASRFSYGTEFNRVGGGVYAVQMENQAIKVWHWPRYNIPYDIRRGHPNPASWGIPIGDLSQWHGGCDVNGTFHTQTIILNTNFCGSTLTPAMWQGDAQCSNYTSCPEFVAKNPRAFDDTYWTINSIKVYERQVVAPAHHQRPPPPSPWTPWGPWHGWRA
ncbi:hypothetical protein GQ53DRAFT_633092, partial [Thozetella sp. PMI_491]